MKKKGILILAVILLSSIMIYFSKDLQRTAQDKLVEKNTTEKNKSKANFIIYDEVSGKEIYSSKVEYDGSKNLATYTKEILKVAGISYSINSSGYASMINDLMIIQLCLRRKVKRLDSCGWVFYINGTKASIGPKDYKPKEEDIVTWRYWKDAMYEK